MELPVNVARQIAEAVQQMPGRPVEITLSPEELGRVRLALSSSEAGVIVNVLAERPETMDLLRRHIGSLETTFQTLGYEEIAFSFSGGNMDQNNDAEASSHNLSNAITDDADTTDVTQVILASGPMTGIDIRL